MVGRGDVAAWILTYAVRRHASRAPGRPAPGPPAPLVSRRQPPGHLATRAPPAPKRPGVDQPHSRPRPRPRRLALPVARLRLGLPCGDRRPGTALWRFELEGADEARAFLTARGIPEGRARLVWKGIALHTTPEIPHHMTPGVALVTADVELDVLGIGYDTLPTETREAIVAAHPRPDFKRRILHAFHMRPGSPPPGHARQCEGRCPGPLRRPLHPPELRPDHRGLPLARVTLQPPPQRRFRRSGPLRAMDFASRRRSCNVVPATPTGKKNRRKAKRS